MKTRASVGGKGLSNHHFIYHVCVYPFVVLCSRLVQEPHVLQRRESCGFLAKADCPLLLIAADAFPPPSSSPAALLSSSNDKPGWTISAARKPYCRVGWTVSAARKS